MNTNLSEFQTVFCLLVYFHIIWGFFFVVSSCAGFHFQNESTSYFQILVHTVGYSKRKYPGTDSNTNNEDRKLGCSTEREI